MKLHQGHVVSCKCRPRRSARGPIPDTLQCRGSCASRGPPKLYFLDTGLWAYLTEWSSPETVEAGAMNGAILETYVLAEVLKSWWNRGKQPPLYYYRDRDGREVDLLLVRDQAIYPLEVKKAASPKRSWTSSFSALDRLGLERSEGGVLCLCRERLPLTDRIEAIPVGLV